jgi:superfamily II DNA or RNA helicase
MNPGAPQNKIAVAFDRGTIVVRGAERPPHVLWDPRSGVYRAPALAYGRVRVWAEECGAPWLDLVAPLERKLPCPIRRLELRPYQEDALRSFVTLGRGGVVSMPTGSGKTRVALAAIAEAGVATVILCPTRALVAQWARCLAEVYGGPIGIASDGEHTTEAITVMTFESAYRHLDRVGASFGMVVVDEAHHFGSGARMEALECLTATRRLGLSATPPAAGSDAQRRLELLIGPVVFELRVAALVGSHLAPLTHIHLPVTLDEGERAAYSAGWEPFASALRALRRVNRAASYDDLMRDLGASPEGRRILSEARAAEDIALFPRAKAALVSRLLDRHGSDRALVFVARTKDAYAIARADFVPAITGETSARERQGILAGLCDGKLRAIVSARVLNEGVDLPDAEIAVLVAGRLGGRELVQRVGRVLRPKEGKRATVYTLATHDTVDARRFEKSWRQLDRH